eukprot:5558375-Pleurochrysis_carterae.AAC.2
MAAGCKGAWQQEGGRGSEWERLRDTATRRHGDAATARESGGAWKDCGAAGRRGRGEGISELRLHERNFFLVLHQECACLRLFRTNRVSCRWKESGQPDAGSQRVAETSPASSQSLRRGNIGFYFQIV